MAYTIVLLIALLGTGGFLVCAVVAKPNIMFDFAVPPVASTGGDSTDWNPRSGESGPNYKPDYTETYSARTNSRRRSSGRSRTGSAMSTHRQMNNADHVAAIGTMMATTNFENRIGRRATDAEILAIHSLIKVKFANE